MENQEIFNLAIGAALTVLGWFGRELWSAVKNLKDDIKNLEVNLPTHYVRKDEINIRFDKLESILDKIFVKLDSKVDK